MNVAVQQVHWMRASAATSTAGDSGTAGANMLLDPRWHIAPQHTRENLPDDVGAFVDLRLAVRSLQTKLELVLQLLNCSVREVAFSCSWSRHGRLPLLPPLNTLVIQIPYVSCDQHKQTYRSKLSKCFWLELFACIQTNNFQQKNF